MNKTLQIQKARALIEVVRKRIVCRGLNNTVIETSVIDSLVLIPKKMQKTFFAASPKQTDFTNCLGKPYAWVQVIKGKPVQVFFEEDLLVVP